MVKFVDPEAVPEPISIEPDIFYAGDNVEVFGEKCEFLHYNGPDHAIIKFERNGRSYSHSVSLRKVRTWRDSSKS